MAPFCRLGVELFTLGPRSASLATAETLQCQRDNMENAPFKACPFGTRQNRPAPSEWFLPGQDLRDRGTAAVWLAAARAEGAVNAGAL